MRDAFIIVRRHVRAIERLSQMTRRVHEFIEEKKEGKQTYWQDLQALTACNIKIISVGPVSPAVWEVVRSPAAGEDMHSVDGNTVRVETAHGPVRDCFRLGRVVVTTENVYVDHDVNVRSRTAPKHLPDYPY